MRIPRFFLSERDLAANSGLLCLSLAEAGLKRLVGSELVITERLHVDQLRNVLRLKQGSLIDVLDMQAHVYRCELQSLSPNVVHSKVISAATAESDAAVDLTVGLSLIKGDRFEFALQKLTEIGVRTVVPIIAQRSVVRADDTTGDAKREVRQSKKMQRWQAIMREAAEQCERATLPQILPAVKIGDFLADFTAGGKLDIAFICAERVKAQPLLSRLDRALTADKKYTTGDCIADRMQIGLLIGPEGGWTEAEVVSAETQGWEPVSLGKRILRAETAAIVSAAQIICSFES